MLRKYWALFVLLGLASILFYIVNRTQQQYQKVKQNGRFVVGEVTTIGSDVICLFSIDGINHERRLSSPNPGIVEGEKYRVYYYSEIPDTYYVAFEEPVILEAEFAETSSVEIDSNDSYIFFSYKVGNAILRRQQQIFGFKIEPNRKYKVFYKVSEPRIAYLMM